MLYVADSALPLDKPQAVVVRGGMPVVWLETTNSMPLDRRLRRMFLGDKMRKILIPNPKKKIKFDIKEHSNGSPRTTAGKS